jgi:polysaccharide deacetylase 2 family uncharacterized protein YibQ
MIQKDQLKNFLITLLSGIVLIQAGLLLYMTRKPVKATRRAAATESRPAATRQPSIPAVALTKPVAKPEPAAVAVAPKPSMVLGRIVIVIDDWGYNLRNRDFIVGNDYRVTLAILPFRVYSTDIARLAHDKGKGILIHMPMEPLHKEQYGLEEKTLLTTMDKGTVVRLLNEAYEAVPYAQGISNHMGSKATEDDRLMRIIMEYLRRKNGIFFDSYVTPKTVGPKTARAYKVRTAARDVFIDNDNDPAAIRQQMRKLAARARQRGIAFGIGHDRPSTIAVLKEMIPELQAEGYVFVNLDDATS